MRKSHRRRKRREERQPQPRRRKIDREGKIGIFEKTKKYDINFLLYLQS